MRLIAGGVEIEVPETFRLVPMPDNPAEFSVTMKGTAEAASIELAPEIVDHRTGMLLATAISACNCILQTLVEPPAKPDPYARRNGNE